MGYATIIHPFHPLRGKCLKVLSSKTFNNRDILSLQGDTSRGIIAIPREWTDKADPNLYDICESLPLLSFVHLQELADLILALEQAHSRRKHDKIVGDVP